MKLYFISNTKKIRAIQGKLEAYFMVEEKENFTFKMTKNDYVVMSNEKSKMKDAEKLKNIILLTCDRNQKFIWRVIHQYKIIDIIDIDLDEKYIAERIHQLVRSNA